jgi:transcription elongation factor Elf1
MRATPMNKQTKKLFSCPLCGAPMNVVEIDIHGVEVNAERCSKCGEEYIDAEDHAKVYRAFRKER